MKGCYKNKSDFGGGIPLAIPWESDLGHFSDFCLFVCLWICLSPFYLLEKLLDKEVSLPLGINI